MGEVQESLWQFPKVTLNLRIHFDVDAGVTVLRTTLIVGLRDDSQVALLHRLNEVAFLPDGSVEGIRDKLPQRHGGLVPVDRAKVETPATVDRLAGRPAQPATRGPGSSSECCRRGRA